MNRIALFALLPMVAFAQGTATDRQVAALSARLAQTEQQIEVTRQTLKGLEETRSSILSQLEKLEPDQR
jgi:septal ring factor EnvC (AmiA/AmiB activator)